jgi:ABC-type microcin C transport system duplicated ATPase subunit YejF
VSEPTNGMESTNGPTSSNGVGPLVRIEDLRVWFPIRSGLVLDRHVGDIKAVDGISLDIARGETVGLVGESGCGKSTAGRATIRLYEPTSGRIEFDGQDITELSESQLRPLRRRMQMIFQDPFASLNPRHSVGRMVGEPLRVHGLAKTRRDTSRRVRELLEIVGLPADAASRYPHEFSGGQRQRIGIARAVIRNSPIMILDEPTAALDTESERLVIEGLQRLMKGRTVIMIAHRLSTIRDADKIIVLKDGVVAEEGTNDELIARGGVYAELHRIQFETPPAPAAAAS